jgi:hypothetical protein
MIEAMGLKRLHRSPLEWHYLRTKFHENLPSGLKVFGKQSKNEGAFVCSKPFLTFP